MAKKEKFDINDPENYPFALKIAHRATALTGLAPINYLLDIQAVKTDIDWELLIKANDFNFIHDMVGINRHLDHDTGELKNGFLPRFTKVNGGIKLTRLAEKNNH